ncbi:transmembrane protein 92-like, partial [Chelydra serpentina]
GDSARPQSKGCRGANAAAVPKPAGTGRLTAGRMPSPRRPPAHLLLVCLFASFQQVSPKTFLLCGISLCSGERCCDGQCCRRYHGLQQEPINGFGLVFIFTGIIMGGICLAAAYKCIKACSALHEREGVEPRRPTSRRPLPGPPPSIPRRIPRPTARWRRSRSCTRSLPSRRPATATSSWQTLRKQALTPRPRSRGHRGARPLLASPWGGGH